MQFPSFKQFNTDERRKLKRLREALRFYAMSFYCAPQIKQFMRFLNENPIWLPLFREKPYRFNTLLSKYCDKRFDKTQRLSAIWEHFDLAEKVFSSIFCERLLNERRLVLLRFEDIELALNLNEIDPLEGFFSVSLRYQAQRIYDASFTLLKSNTLLIASVQGTNTENAQELIKVITKKLHGIRPMFMLIYLFKMLCADCNLVLLGIPHKYQVKYRFNDKSRLLFNYDNFWRENGADLVGDYWRLNNGIERKLVEDIPSKKRSMYRKRYEMLDRLNESVRCLTRQ